MSAAPRSENAFGVLVVGWVLGWPSGAVRAAVAMKGWEWFVTDTFGVPELGFVEAWGLFMLVSFATFQFTGDDTEKRPAVVLGEAIAASLFISAFTFVSLLALVSLR
jgi:hypothetical protein